MAAPESFSYKRIADPVHGSIGISEIESKILNTKSFLRLRNISQLGLADFVYPSGNYSRFSHSLGVCSITGKMLNSLCENGSDFDDFSPKDIKDQMQLYRLSGLLHDIGHYPFSHAMEFALDECKVNRLFEDSDTEKQYIKHENLGAIILEEDPEISTILRSHSIEPKDVHSIFNRTEPTKLANLISSDLDADRIDYMLRTSKSTGLPYGNVDIDYLISQIGIDKDKNVCLPEKALRTAEHFLLGRFFEYQQVYFHKAVIGIELVLRDVLKEMVSLDILNCTENDVLKMIRNGAWYNFDEIYMFSMMRNLLDSNNIGHVLRKKIYALSKRRMPKLVYNDSKFINISDDAKDVKRHKKSLEYIIAELSKKYSIDKSLWYLWSKATSFTKLPANILVGEGYDTDKAMQSVYIRNSEGQSAPIMSLPHSLMSLVSNYKLQPMRVYVLLDDDQQKLFPEIKREFLDC